MRGPEWNGDAQPDAAGSVLRGLGNFPNKQKIAFVSRKPCLPNSGLSRFLSILNCKFTARKWKLWKEKEEKILRDSGASKDMIEAIRLYDRQAFNSDRRYYERVQETGTYLDTVAASIDQAEPKTVQDFLDRIENQELYHVLITVDRLTLQIVLMKIQGYSTHEIARYLKITEKAVYRRMDRLKEKVKKIFE